MSKQLTPYDFVSLTQFPIFKAVEFFLPMGLKFGFSPTYTILLLMSRKQKTWPRIETNTKLDISKTFPFSF